MGVQMTTSHNLLTGNEPANRRIEGEHTYWDCPECGFPICTWTDCPECEWYSEPAWNRAIKAQETT